ncbi:MAG: hypothetical protein ACI8ZN_001970 [Bacteroidia bacterium]
MCIDKRIHTKTSAALSLALLTALFAGLISSFHSCGGKSQARDLSNETHKTKNDDVPNKLLTDELIFPEVKVLLASRFNSMEEFKQAVDLKYLTNHKDSLPGKNSKGVILRYRQNKHAVESSLLSGISQGDLMIAREGSFWNKLKLAFIATYCVAKRSDLSKVYVLARRKSEVLGVGDVAFFDLALSSVSHISDYELACITAKDSSEKGYLNSFNHVTAQALMTTMFSERTADLIGDMHERYNMPELISGQFSEAQLSNANVNPIDNYVDMMNNELGQILGRKLRDKHNINKATVWTERLLSDYLNDVQKYYGWSFGIAFTPFKSSDEEVIRFTTKINDVIQGRIKNVK